MIPDTAWMSRVTSLRACQCSLDCRQYYTVAYVWGDGTKQRMRQFWLSKS